ncbi:Uncharacterised protein [uncultured archaeon]|nr:Uncharacterised protein [uncultured archaeon]
MKLKTRSIIVAIVMLLLVNSNLAFAFTAYITKTGDGVVSVFDTSTNKVTATVNVGGSPWDIAINPAGTLVYVTKPGDGVISVIDTSTNTVTATVNVGGSPMGIAIGRFAISAYPPIPPTPTVTPRPTPVNPNEAVYAKQRAVISKMNITRPTPTPTTEAIPTTDVMKYIGNVIRDFVNAIFGGKI